MPNTTISLYLPYTLSFDVDVQNVTLYGAFLVSTSSFEFKLGSDLPASVRSQLPSSSGTTQISAPFGLNGMVLEDFGISGGVYKRTKNGASVTAVDFTLFASARFTALSGFTLSGAIVVEESVTRLAIVALSSARYLTLTEFLRTIMDGQEPWGSEVTDQFAFGAGYLYYLQRPSGASTDYTYSYTPSGGSAITCTPGLNLASSFRLFDQFYFDVRMAMDGVNFTLEAATAAPINIYDFISLDSAAISISKKGNISTGWSINLTTEVSLFGAPVSGQVSAKYNTGSSRFLGDFDVDLDDVSLPGGDSQSVTLGVSFAWAKTSGIKILDIRGLPSMDVDFVEQFADILNNARSHGCERMLSDWFNSLTQTKVTPSLNGSMKRLSNGKMEVPLKLRYQILSGGSELSSADIEFGAVLTVPNGLDDLPNAIWSSIFDSLGSIAEDILSDPDTYQVVLQEAIRRGGAQAAAKALCRALDEGLSAVVRALAAMAAELVITTLAEAVLLAGFLIAAALIGVVALKLFFEKVWEEIKEWFGDDSKKDDARRKLNELRAQVEETIDEVDALVASVKHKIAIEELHTSLGSDGQPVAYLRWQFAQDASLEGGGDLALQFRVLSGAPGSEQGSVLSEASDQSFPVTYEWPELPWPGYQMNAAVRSVLTGYTFLNEAGRSAILDAIEMLGEIDDSTADDFADYLQGKLNEYESYNSAGVQSDWVYAQSDVPSQMTVGQSHIGLNTRIVSG